MMRHTGPLHLQQDDLNEQNLATKSPGINASKVSIGTDNKNCSDENEISQRNENAVPSEIIAPNKENVASNAQDPGKHKHIAKKKLYFLANSSVFFKLMFSLKVLKI